MKHQTAESGGIDIYAVGLLADLRGAVHAPHSYRRQARRTLLRGFRRGWRRGAYWNGYLAEPTVNDGTWTRCGHGWTRGRAYDDLQRHLAEQAPSAPPERPTA